MTQKTALCTTEEAKKTFTLIKMNHYKKTTIKALLVMLVIFLFVFFLAYYNFSKGIPIFDIGMPAQSENIVVMFFSVAAILKVIYDTYNIENHLKYEKRIKENI